MQYSVWMTISLTGCYPNIRMREIHQIYYKRNNIRIGFYTASQKKVISTNSIFAPPAIKLHPLTERTQSHANSWKLVHRIHSFCAKIGPGNTNNQWKETCSAMGELLKIYSYWIGFILFLIANFCQKIQLMGNIDQFSTGYLISTVLQPAGKCHWIQIGMPG